MPDPQTRPIPREAPPSRTDVRAYIDDHDREADAALARAAGEAAVSTDEPPDDTGTGDAAAPGLAAEDVAPGHPAPEPTD